MFKFIFDIFNNTVSDILAAAIICSIIIVKKLWHKFKSRSELKSEAMIASPDSKKVCYILAIGGRREIYICDVNSGQIFNLKISVVAGQTPAWSPDSDKIALVSEQDGNKEIYVVNADGTNRQRITNDPAEDICPQWSADGSKLTYFTRKNGFLVVKTVDVAKLEI